MLKLLLLCISIPLLASDLEMTRKNLEGQKNLYSKGWFIVTSPSEAWDYAVKNNEQSKIAFKQALDKISLSTETSTERLKKADKTRKDMNRGADRIHQSLSKSAEEVQKAAFAASSVNFKEAWSKLNLGYLQYRESNQDDMEALKEVNRNFFKKINEDIKDFKEAFDPVLGSLLVKSEVHWKKYFKEGKFNFNEQYEKSGTRGNSVVALWDILVGYASWSYHSLLRPGSKAAYQSTKSIPYYTVDLISKTFIASYNVIHSLGANLYYPTKLGYKVISPSLESGYLASLALLQSIYGAAGSKLLEGAGIINKVAIKGTAPLAAGSQFVIEETSTMAMDAATVIVHGAEASAEVILEKIESGVVLGYSALSQIPPQLLLTATNSAIFLVYDGPRLILTKVSGKIGDKDIGEVPVGSVLNMEKMRSSGLKVETISEDPEVIKKVLENVE